MIRDHNAKRPFDNVLGPQPMHHSRERNHFADVLKPADPRDRALEPESEARVRERPVPAEIQVPIVRGRWEALLVDSGPQLVVIVLALRAADDLAVAFGGEAVVTEDGAVG